MMKFRLAVLSLAAFCFSAQCLAGVIIGGTRIIYQSDKKEVQFRVKNKDTDTRHLVQSWISGTDDKKAPFIITPPLIKLDEEKETLLHVVFTGDRNNLPSDRETLFWTNVKTVGSTPQELKDRNYLQLTFKNRIKLFFRPKALNTDAANDAYEKLTFSREGNTLKVTNPTPYYVSFNSLSVGGKAVPSYDKSRPDAETMMIPPKSSVSYPMPATTDNTVTWSSINDYGGLTPVKKSTL